METVLEMRGITKRFPGVLALDSVDFDLRRGEVHVLAGENGAGKSTLVKILAGAYTMDVGELLVNGQSVRANSPHHAQQLGISAIYQEFNLVPYMSVMENIFLGREVLKKKTGIIDWKRMISETKEVLTELKLDLDPTALVKDLGIAQQQLVEVGKALSQKAKIIIMDEPTAVLTNREIDLLFATIRDVTAKGVSIIYISHRMEEYEEIGDRVTIMRDGKTITTDEIRNLAIPDMIKLMVGRELKEQFPKRSVEIGGETLRVANLSCGRRVKNVSFTLNKGEILGLSGLVGSGRTELVRAIFGADHPDSGDIWIDGKKIDITSPQSAISKGIGLATEDRKNQGLVLPMGVDNNVTLSNLKRYKKGLFLDLKGETRDVVDYIDKLRIKTPSSTQKVANLSGGNQQKVVLAKLMVSGTKIFLFDEPTRGIDVGAKKEVYHLMNQIVADGGSILMISSELPEILGMSDRILVMCRGGLAATLNREEATQEIILSYAAGGVS